MSKTAYLCQINFMSEKLLGENDKINQFIEYDNLLSRASAGIEALSLQERERLVELGYHYLEVEKNANEAIRAFRVVHDFEGLRQVADQLLREQPDNYDLPRAFTLLEDHEGMRDFLNKEVKSNDYKYELAFRSLKEPLFEYIDKFLNENKTPVATGAVNGGNDIIAIRNLARQYDIAVPIARGGLMQGAIANLWGMPTKIADITAHNRKIPKSKWINPVTAEDFTGKHVLLFDKDAVTGASIRQAVKMLARFQPANIGIYFTHNVKPTGVTRIEGLPPGLEIFYPDNAPMQEAGDAYIEAHEKLGTLYGRRRQTEHLFIEEAQKLKEQYPGLAESLKTFISEQLRAFDSLNPYLPGISEVREQILIKLYEIYKNHIDLLKNNMYSLPGVVDNFKQILATTQPLPIGFEAELIKARFEKQAKEAAQKRNIENPHYPSNPLAAFNAARAAVKKGFDIALIIGPEGFAYEPYFRDLGLPTLAVNIPESGENEPRTITLFDDLAVLRGKKILVVEDDIRTGTTLQKLVERIRPHAPAQLGLYLGQPEVFQKVANIPPEFIETYIIESDTDQVAAGKNFQEYLETKGLKIFKTIKTSE